jgi:hypothetical protein
MNQSNESMLHHYLEQNKTFQQRTVESPFLHVTMAKSKHSNSKGGNKKDQPKQKPKRRQVTASSKSWNSQASHKTHKNKREVVFDPEARKAYLRGFSERKRQRRAFGLAMQKVKDRQARIEQRAQEKKDELERVKQAEEQKETLMEEYYLMHNPKASKQENDDSDDEEESKIESNSEDSDNDSNHEGGKQQGSDKKRKQEDVIDTKVYEGKKTEATWGGHVRVTISSVELDGNNGDDMEEDDDVAGKNSAAKRDKSVDVAQKYAGNVQRYLHELKGSMPGKHKGDGAGRARRKGRNGAADMKGIGGSGNLKVASKLLAKSKDKNVTAFGKKKGKKGRR